MVVRKPILIALALGLPFAAHAGIKSGALGSGHASYYSHEFAGKRTASGETFNPNALTAAHRSVAFGSKVRVTNLANGKDVVVRINDRGPWTKGRIIDISYAAAKQIGMHRSGTARVRLDMISK